MKYQEESHQGNDQLDLFSREKESDQSLEKSSYAEHTQAYFRKNFLDQDILRKIISEKWRVYQFDLEKESTLSDSLYHQTYQHEKKIFQFLSYYISQIFFLDFLEEYR